MNKKIFRGWSFSANALRLLTAFLAACVLWPVSPATAGEIASADQGFSEEYKVYDAIIGYMATGAGSDKNSKISSGGTISVAVCAATIKCDPKTSKYLRGDVPEASADTISDFSKKNVEAGTVEAKFNAPVPCVIADEKECDAFISGKTDWAAFYKKYSGAAGIVKFSKVAFGSKDDEALVEVAYHASKMSGFGKYFLLRRENGVWKVLKTFQIWMS